MSFLLYTERPLDDTDRVRERNRQRVDHEIDACSDEFRSLGYDTESAERKGMLKTVRVYRQAAALGSTPSQVCEILTPEEG